MTLEMTPAPHEWPGVDPIWSKTVDVVSTASVDAGTTNRWHYLDNIDALEQAGLSPIGTILAVHGNPTWSYLWRKVVAGGVNPNHPWRVIAVDQLDMGYSVRTGLNRRLADRVRDLSDFTQAIGLDETELPVVTLAHDWGGAISSGWAIDHANLVKAILLTNTAVWQDAADKLPAALQLALAPAVHGVGTQKTTTFIDVTLSLKQKPWDKDEKATYRLPYNTEEKRQGVRNFVADIPVTPDAPSYPELVRIAEGLKTLDVPAFFQWGTKDPVFQRRFMADLQNRLPKADVHRYEKASHLVQEDEDIVTPLFDWLGDHFSATQTQREAHVAERARLHGTNDFKPMISELIARKSDSSLAIVDMDQKKVSEIASTMTWAQLHDEVVRTAEGLKKLGIAKGTRVNLMVPPGAQLTTLIYACISLGAVIVVADTGLGAKGLTRALKGARPEYLIGINKALVAARSFGWPGMRIAVESMPSLAAKGLGIIGSVADFPAATGSLSTDFDPEDDAAILYTSGSTGPAKGVVYTQRQLSGMREAIQNTYHLEAGTGLVAGFAPFALLGPALGATSVTPAMDVTSPKTLTAKALAAAAQAIDATCVFASPAALMNVVRTASGLDTQLVQALGKIDLMLSAGAPLSIPLLTAVASLVPNASIHTPYGMTEALPITDVDFETIKQAEQDGAATDEHPAMVGARGGVCVGTAVHAAQVKIAPLDAEGQPIDELSDEPGVTGEIVVSAPHVKDRYDTLYVTERVSTSTPGWHHTGDIGHFDAAGRLWVEGRLAHVLVTAQGVITPVALEQAAELVPAVRRAAIAGVGESGTTVPVAIVETDPVAKSDGRAASWLVAQIRDKVREETGIELAAVLTVREHPTDIRHNSKIDRPLLGEWASEVLAGKKAKLRK